MFEPSPPGNPPRSAEAWKPWMLDWNQIAEPGCYLHLPSGLLARVFSREDSPVGRGASDRAGAAIRLSSDPHAPLDRLREIANQHALPVAF